MFVQTKLVVLVLRTKNKYCKDVVDDTLVPVNFTPADVNASIPFSGFRGNGWRSSRNVTSSTLKVSSFANAEVDVKPKVR
ncbi:hypothetical protein [Pseudoalteromonas obscura]|uniref:Uncharacterized protein n=1 Tax=Pseudoalteromonas obscura TaxID=3048491 RepID=A0ABT7EPG1_9GAMM|nr:hypothetical protein [Pseudoalteromonas sp. P94(2023)]MDK2596935.1 hypothetical protein [Pseudoalteromonas sp. P94(2023)]